MNLCNFNTDAPSNFAVFQHIRNICKKEVRISMMKLTYRRRVSKRKLYEFQSIFCREQNLDYICTRFRHQGRLAQLVQSICLTSRGSAVRTRHRPQKSPYQRAFLHYFTADRVYQLLPIRFSFATGLMKRPGLVSCIFCRNCILATSSGTHTSASIQVELSILTYFVFFEFLYLLAFMV